MLQQLYGWRLKLDQVLDSILESNISTSWIFAEHDILNNSFDILILVCWILYNQCLSLLSFLRNIYMWLWYFVIALFLAYSDRIDLLNLLSHVFWKYVRRWSSVLWWKQLVAGFWVEDCEVVRWVEITGILHPCLHLIRHSFAVSFHFIPNHIWRRVFKVQFEFENVPTCSEWIKRQSLVFHHIWMTEINSRQHTLIDRTIQVVMGRVIACPGYFWNTLETLNQSVRVYLL